MAKTKLQKFRETKRSTGHRLIQQWVIDARTIRFKDEAERQSLLVSSRTDPEDIFAYPEAFAVLR